MHFVLQGIGTFLAIIGIVLIRYGVPLDEYGNSPLLMSGMVALVGGLLLAALSFVLRALNRIADRLEIQPLLAPPVGDLGHPPPRAAPPVVRPEPVAPPPSAPPPSAPPVAVEPRIEPPVTPPRAEPVPAPPRVEPRVEVPTPAPRIDTMPPPPRGKSLFGWLGGKPGAAAVVSRKAPAEPAEATRPDPAPPAQAPEEPRVPAPPAGSAAPPPVTPPAPPSAVVYKSGVIDGMAYTLYTDGSIEAQLPQGPIRFASVEALQSYLVGR
jgi:hypothetical protein